MLSDESFDTALRVGDLDAALVPLADAGVISCCMPEFPFWPCAD